MDRTSADAGAGEYVSRFTKLMRSVKDEGLLERRRGYYWWQIGAHVAAFFAIWAGFFVLGNSWWRLALAALLGVVVTQFGFLGHDAAHRQVFTHCEREGIDYLEVGLFHSYAIVVDYLNNVGIRARDPFDCPLAAQVRG